MSKEDNLLNAKYERLRRRNEALSTDRRILQEELISLRANKAAADASDPHDATIDYLMKSAETFLQAARCLIDMRTTPTGEGGGGDGTN